MSEIIIHSIDELKDIVVEHIENGAVISLKLAGKEEQEDDKEKE